jgi:putative hydrolase of the HAD superfamily
MKRHRAIFFDAGNTLFAVHPSVGAWYAEVARQYGTVCDPRQMEEYFRAEWDARSRGSASARQQTPDDERNWWRGLVRGVMDRAGRVRRFEAFFEELYDLFASGRVWRVFPEVESVLATCRERGVVLGIVSNWDSRLLKICEALHLTPKVDFILASNVVGVAKPDPRIFHLALRQAGVTAAEALHIGDSLQEDVFGAMAAGLEALWLTRSGSSEAPPKVTKVDSLLSILDRC